MRKQAYIGIDPGKSGSICVLIPSIKKVHFFPTTDTPAELIYMLGRAQKELNVVIAVIEDVHAIFGTSAKSNFNFGFNTGHVTGIIQASGISVTKVTPKVWQKYVGVKSKGKLIKKEVAEICTSLYPEVNVRGPKGGLLDGKSDSLCIAHYAAYNFQQDT